MASENEQKLIDTWSNSLDNGFGSLDKLLSLFEKNAMRQESGQEPEQRSFRQRRKLTVKNDTGEVKPFTKNFAQFLLQVAINLSPFRTGNLRDNIGLVYTPYSIEIVFNAKGTAFYGMYLDAGYPSFKWFGWMDNIKQTIRMLCAWYQSQDDEDLLKLKGAIAMYGVGGKFMNAVNVMNDKKTVESVVRFRRRRGLMGYESTELKKQKQIIPKYVTPQSAGDIDVFRNDRYKHTPLLPISKKGEIIKPLERTIVGDTEVKGRIDSGTPKEIKRVVEFKKNSAKAKYDAMYEKNKQKRQIEALRKLGIERKVR